MPTPRYDTLIIGQGLAGSALAWQLIDAGQRVAVVDDGHLSSSSIVAAGLINPLAGLRFTRRPELDDWLAAATTWYAALAAAFGRDFYHPLPMLRLLRSAEQRRFYERRAQDPLSRPLLDEAFTAATCPEPLHAPFGGFIQRQTGFVDLPNLLDALRHWLRERATLVERTLRYDEIRLDDMGVELMGLRATRIVFCDGARLRDNPWFGGLPLMPEKGEILNVIAPDWPLRHIVNGAFWMVPQGDGEIRLGATHDHHRCDQQPTDAGQSTLLAGFAALRPDLPPPRVTQHVAGIRPGTRDRYPLIGHADDNTALWVFNGFGARGSLTIPWYAQCLAQHLVHARPLPAEADIGRFA
ncbi:MAG: FAD-binding oxidoreductase [Gammaproteobacteria bacterium]|nr:FAD-binding oxidoreductase [Gammaproteobacteria bacterium]